MLSWLNNKYVSKAEYEEQIEKIKGLHTKTMLHMVAINDLGKTVERLETSLSELTLKHKELKAMVDKLATRLIGFSKTGIS